MCHSKWTERRELHIDIV